MRLTLAAACLAAALLVTTGCVEATQKVTLNPDGSGKAVLDMKITPIATLLQTMGLPGDDDKAKADAMAKRIIGGLVFHSKAIDAWKDVAYTVGQDGHIHFTGTAYFKNINKLALGGEGPQAVKVSWQPNPNGGMDLALVTPTPPMIKKDAAPLTDDQIDQAIAQIHARWEAARVMLAPALESFKFDGTYILPGVVDKSSILKPVSGGVYISLDGRKILTAMDRYVDDERRLRTYIKARHDPEFPDPDRLSELVFGQTGKISAHVAGDVKPLFDYAAESAAAKQAEPAMIEKLGISPNTPKLERPRRGDDAGNGQQLE